MDRQPIDPDSTGRNDASNVRRMGEEANGLRRWTTGGGQSNSAANDLTHNDSRAAWPNQLSSRNPDGDADAIRDQRREAMNEPPEPARADDRADPEPVPADSIADWFREEFIRVAGEID